MIRMICGSLIGIFGFIGFAMEIGDYQDNRSWDLDGLLLAAIFVAVGGSLFYYGRLAKISKEAITDKSVGDKEEITSSEEAISDNDKDSPEDKLTKLSELKEKGLIDEEDYNSKKEEILKTI